MNYNHIHAVYVVYIPVNPLEPCGPGDPCLPGTPWFPLAPMGLMHNDNSYMYTLKQVILAYTCTYVSNFTLLNNYILTVQL